VRVELEESLTGPIIDASIGFTLFNREKLDLGSEYAIGSRLEPGTPLYRFNLATVDPNRGLIDYTGETLLRRLSRIPADKQIILRPRGTPYTPQECLQAVLATYEVPNTGVPPLRMLGANGPFTPEVPAFAYFPPKKQDNREPDSVLELIQRCLAPFEGYYVRANIANALEILPPPWATPPGMTLTTADILELDPGELDPSTVVNRCTVRSQGYGFSDTPEEVMQPASFGLRGKRLIGSLPWESQSPIESDLTGLKLNNAPVINANSQGAVLNWPLMPQTVIGGDTLEVQWAVTLWVREFPFGTANAGTTTGTSQMPLDGSTTRIILKGFQFGSFPRPPDAYGSVQIFARWLPDDEAVAISWSVDLTCDSLSLFSSGITVWGVRVELHGLAPKLDLSKNIVAATFGDKAPDDELVPGLSISRNRYGLRPKTIDAGIYQLSPDLALAIAQNQVERGLNPKQVYRVRQAANMPVRPWHLNQHVTIPSPDGTGTLQGVVRAWRYAEAHGPNGASADSEFELELISNVFGEVSTATAYGDAIYGLSRYL